MLYIAKKCHLNQELQIAWTLYYYAYVKNVLQHQHTTRTNTDQIKSNQMWIYIAHCQKISNDMLGINSVKINFLQTAIGPY